MKSGVAIAILVTTLLACAKDLSELEPYPCALDKSCPSGFACVDGVCGKPRVDSLGCEDLEFPIDCSLSGLTCYRGACVEACNDDQMCPEGRLCTPDEFELGAACALDCTFSPDVCLPGFECKRRFTDNRSVCVPDGVTFFACDRTEDTSLCISEQCGQDADYHIPCGQNFCPHNSTCPDPNAPAPCLCGEPFKTCDGQVVTDPPSQCPVVSGNPQCWCLLSDENQPSCFTRHFHSRGTCVCKDGRRLAFSCGRDESCEDACQQ